MRKLLILLCLPIIGFGQCMSGDCENGFGIHGLHPEFEKYEGYFKDGEFHGQGAMTLHDGMIKEGLWEYGKLIIKLEDIYKKTPSENNNKIEEEDDKLFMVVQNMPEFPGGDLGLIKYIQKNVKYPLIARKYDITGKVYVQYVVDEKGNVTDVKVERGIHKSLDMEAFRVISSLPKYKPGLQRGKPCKVFYRVPINFTLH